MMMMMLTVAGSQRTFDHHSPTFTVSVVRYHSVSIPQ